MNVVSSHRDKICATSEVDGPVMPKTIFSDLLWLLLINTYLLSQLALHDVCPSNSVLLIVTRPEALVPATNIWRPMREILT